MTKKFGPTGTFPGGKLDPTDEGALNIGVGHDSKGTVILNFGTTVAWIGLRPEQAIRFAKLIMKHAGAKKITVEI